MNFLKNIIQLCKNLSRPSQNKDASPSPSAQKNKKNFSAYSLEKQKKLEEMCEKLFERQELVTTGKVQFLGLNKVKKKFGKKWDGLKPLVFETIENVISQYIRPPDIFIRYKEDAYVLLFAHADVNEAQIKAMLITEEIKRQLFSYQEDSLNDLDLENSVSVIKTQNLRKAKDLHTIIGLVVSETENVPPPPPLSTPIKIDVTMEINPYKNSTLDKDKAQQEKSLNCVYVPLWDVKKNALTTYLYLMQGKNPLMDDPFDNYDVCFAGLSLSKKNDLDIKILKQALKQLDETFNSGRKLYISCPVHYETLRKIESYQQFIVECQKVPEEQKQFLVFLIIGIPETLRDPNMEIFLGALKKHCFALYAQMQLDSKTDFYLLNRLHFNAVGIRLKKVRGSEKETIDKLNIFSKNAKAALIPNVFALDVTSLSITTSAVCADFDFLGGNAIHECVPKPSSMCRFKYQDLFTDFIKTDDSV